MSGDVVDLIMNDHREVERLFEELRTQPDKRANLVPVLTTLLTAHSRAEEAEVYPAARDEAGAADEVEHSQEERLDSLGEAFLAARAEHLGEQPGEMTKEQLSTQAANVDLEGISGMTKDELADALKERASR